MQSYRHSVFVQFFVGLLRAWCLPVLLSLAAAGAVQAQEVEPGFANAAQPGDIRIGGLGFGYAADSSMAEGTATINYTGPTLGHCAASAPVTVSLGVFSPYLSISVNGTSRYLSYSGSTSTSVNVGLNFGANLVTVISIVSSDTLTYNIMVQREAATSNANLAGLAISGASLEQTFDSAVTDYTAHVMTRSISLTPTTSDCSTVSINGATVASGTASGAIPLALGSNLIPVLVTAQDGTTKTYTLTVIRGLSAEARLAGLSLSAGSLSPAFDSAVFNYTASVTYPVSALSVTPAPMSPEAVMMVNGTTVTNGSSSAGIPLIVGDTPITVQSTAEDGSASKTYSVLVTRTPSGANLSALSLSVGSLSPAFSTSTSNYSADVPYGVTSVRLTPTAADNAAAVKVNGMLIQSGNSAGVALNAGVNLIPVQVDRGGGDIRNYQVSITRAARADHPGHNPPSFAPPLNAAPGSGSPSGDIPSIVVMGDFNGDGKLDMAVADGNSTVISIMPGRGDGSFDASLNTTLVSFAGRPVLAMVAGDFNGDGRLDLALTNDTQNTIAILLGNGDGTFFTAANPPVAWISPSLTVGDFNGDGRLDLAAANRDAGNVSIFLGNGDGSFEPKRDYGVIGGARSIAVGDFDGDGKLDLAVAGMSLLSTLLGNGDGSFGRQANYLLGASTLAYSVAVADFDGDGKDDLAVTGHGPGSPMAFVAIQLGRSFGNFMPPTHYATGNSYPEKIVLNDFNGDGELDIAVLDGAGIVSMLPGLGDGTFNVPSFYTGSATVGKSIATGDLTGDGKSDLALANFLRGDVSVLRNVSPELVALTLSHGSLSPDFSGTVADYAAAVPHEVAAITMTPWLAFGVANAQINGVAVADGAASDEIALAPGNNVITVLTHARDGGSRTYTVTLFRASIAADLDSLVLSSGALAPAFATDLASYTAVVGNEVDFLRVTPTARDAGASITVNGMPVASGSASAPIALGFGPNLITVLVTPNDGTSARIYTVTVTRRIGLSSLLLSSGVLTPAFATENASYLAVVPASLAFLSVTPTTADTSASITVNGATVPSGSASLPIPLNFGDNLITVFVVDQNGLNIAGYTIKVARPAGLNDTGQAVCFGGAGLGLCEPADSGDGAANPRQDGRLGRDAAARAGVLQKIGAGAAGFDFTRVCMSGETAGQGACPADPVAGINPNEWACTRDNVTHLVWSLESDAGDWTSHAAVAYPAATNAANRCGYSSGWRVPTRRELLSILNNAEQNPAIDSLHFPNTPGGPYWSANPHPLAPNFHWGVDFYDGSVFILPQNGVAFVRLVRGGQ